MSTDPSYANCEITTNKDSDLTNLIRDKGWNFDNYKEVCQELKRHNLGVKFTQIAYISKHQTTVSTSIRLYPLDIYMKYNEIILTSSGKASILSNPERTTTMVNLLRYEDANGLLNTLTTNKEQWKEILDEIAFIRKHIR